MEHTTDSRSAPHPLADLLRELREEGVTLFRQEIALAKTEMSEKTDRLTHNAVQCGIGAGVAVAGLFVLLIGLSYLMSHIYLGLGVATAYAAWLGPVTVGLLTAIVGWVLIAKARNALKREHLAPDRTLNSLRETKEWAQHKLHSPHQKPAV